MKRKYAAWSARLNEHRAVGKTRDEAVYNLLANAGAAPGWHRVWITPQTEAGDAAAAAKEVVVAWKSVAKIDRHAPADFTPAHVGGAAAIHDELNEVRNVLAPALGLDPSARDASSALHLARRIADLFQVRTAPPAGE